MYAYAHSCPYTCTIALLCSPLSLHSPLSLYAHPCPHNIPVITVCSPLPLHAHAIPVCSPLSHINPNLQFNVSLFFRFMYLQKHLSFQIRHRFIFDVFKRVILVIFINVLKYSKTKLAGHLCYSETRNETVKHKQNRYYKTEQF